mmetsp:Transcript_19391/g.23173  ORF Transcript_19391/g.23173 Transcript_19391/m.23173 type:complete len:397 (-) Transcript_19391:160-1350(-)
MAEEKRKIFDSVFGSDSDSDNEDGPSAPVEEAPAAVSIPKGLGLSDSDEEDEAVAPPETGSQPFKSSLEGEIDSDEEAAFGGAAFGEKKKELNTGPPLELEAPLERNPADFKLLKTSNILGIEPRPFNPETHVPEGAVVTDESGRSTVKLAQNTVRWRYVVNSAGDVVRESNARIVRWSDGSQQLLLGDEVLDLSELPCSVDQNYLYTRHPGLIQCLGQINTKINYRPTSLLSKSHKKLTAIVDKTHQKVKKVQKTVVLVDPEREKERREKAEEERIRGREVLQNKQEKSMARYSSYNDYGYSSQQYYNQQTYPEEEEPEEDWGGAVQARQVSYEEEEERERRILNAKRETVSAKKRSRGDSSDEDEVLSEVSDEEPAKKETKRARNVVLDSDDED